MLKPVLRGPLEQVGGSSPLFTQMGGSAGEWVRGNGSSLPHLCVDAD